MKLTRLLFSLSLGLVVLAGPGCRNNTIVVPTDEEARKRAMETPPPPIGFGNVKDTPQPPGVPKDSPFKVQGAPGATGGTGGAGEKK